MFPALMPWPMTCPEVTVILHHAKQMSKLFYSFGQLNHKCIYLINVRFDTISGEYISQVVYFKCAECHFFSADF